MLRTLLLTFVVFFFTGCLPEFPAVLGVEKDDMTDRGHVDSTTDETTTPDDTGTRVDTSTDTGVATDDADADTDSDTDADSDADADSDTDSDADTDTDSDTDTGIDTGLLGLVMTCSDDGNGLRVQLSEGLESFLRYPVIGADNRRVVLYNTGFTAFAEACVDCSQPLDASLGAYANFYIEVENESTGSTSLLNLDAVVLASGSEYYCVFDTAADVVIYVGP